MALSPGTRLGPYEIIALLGAGGMGEVYRARDAKLGRDVAIKVMPSSFAGDADRLHRFEHEAQVLASLNHPHIGAIYGVEEAEGVVGLVLELIEGETLDERLSRGSLTLEDALPIASQIASALEAAHDKGIIHRDLKPSNIKITPEGLAKVLDFGLARSSRAAEVDLSHSPTTPALTRDGDVVGTVTFMSPEQARGKVVDKSTDIWAFGCVLYQMLAGRPQFDADNQADMIAAILHHEPAWNRLPDRTPLSMRRLLRRCLQKDSRRRLRDIGDARLEIDETIADVPDTGIPRPSASARWDDVQFRRLTDFVGLKEAPAISPDGKMVAFVSLVDGKRQVWIRLLAGGVPLQVTRDRVDHEHPRWSPDSSAILYYSPSDALGGPGMLWEVSALGGQPRRVAASLGGGDISHDGRRVALFRAAGDHVELAIVTRDGSRTEMAARLTGDCIYTLPRWSPDDRWIACQRATSATFGVSLCVASAAGGEMREVVRAYWLRGLSWLPDGSGFVYSSSVGSTMLYPAVFNLRNVALDGTRDLQLTFGDVSYVEPDAHRSGRLVVTRMRSQSDIWRFPVAGSPLKNTRGATRVTRQTGQVQVPSVSPDSRQIVYLSDNGGHSNLWVANIDGSNARQITFEENPTVSIGLPRWAPVGDGIAFLIGRSGQVELWLVEPDGSGLRQVSAHGWYPCWSADGQWLYYTSTRGINQIEKVQIDHGAPIQVRGDGYAPAIVANESILYYITSVRPETPKWGDLEIRRAQPEDGPSDVLARVAGSRVPMAPMTFAPSLSPDGRWLAAPLLDGSTTNLWMLPTSGRCGRSPILASGPCSSRATSPGRATVDSSMPRSRKSTAMSSCSTAS